MRQNTSIILLGVALAAVTGLFGSSVTGVIGTSSTVNTLDNGAYMVGHLTFIVEDMDGNIKEYRQTDNVIVSNGENCASKMLFGGAGGATAGTGVCTGAITQPFNVIAIGTGATGEQDTDIRLETETAATGMARAAGTIVYTNATGGDTADVVIENTFTNTSGGSVAVTESGLFNGTSIIPDDKGMFARQTFSAINVADQDALTVEWTINIGTV